MGVFGTGISVSYNGECPPVGTAFFGSDNTLPPDPFGYRVGGCPQLLDAAEYPGGKKDTGKGYSLQLPDGVLADSPACPIGLAGSGRDASLSAYTGPFGFATKS